MAIKTLVFEQKKLTLCELKEALINNFGHSDVYVPAEPPVASCCGSQSAKTSTDELTQLVTKLVQQILTQTGNSPIAKTATKSTEGEYIRQMLINGAPKYGNDLDEADDMAREAALIYCTEVQRYKNPRGGQFQPGDARRQYGSAC